MTPQEVTDLTAAMLTGRTQGPPVILGAIPYIQGKAERIVMREGTGTTTRAVAAVCIGGVWRPVAGTDGAIAVWSDVRRLMAAVPECEYIAAARGVTSQKLSTQVANMLRELKTARACQAKALQRAALINQLAEKREAQTAAAAVTEWVDVLTARLATIVQTAQASGLDVGAVQVVDGSACQWISSAPGSAGSTGTPAVAAAISVTLTAPAASASTRPTFTGSAEVEYRTPVVFMLTDAAGAVQTWQVIGDQQGAFTTAAPQDVAEGAYTVTAYTISSQGVAGAARATGIIDTHAPALALYVRPTTAVSADGERAIAGAVRIIVSGADHAAPIVLRVATQDDSTVQQAILTSDGAGAASDTLTLGAGTYTITATQADAAGNIGTATTTLTLMSTTTDTGTGTGTGGTSTGTSTGTGTGTGGTSTRAPDGTINDLQSVVQDKRGAIIYSTAATLAGNDDGTLTLTGTTNAPNWSTVQCYIKDAAGTTHMMRVNPDLYGPLTTVQGGAFAATAGVVPGPVQAGACQFVCMVFSGTGAGGQELAGAYYGTFDMPQQSTDTGGGDGTGDGSTTPVDLSTVPAKWRDRATVTLDVSAQAVAWARGVTMQDAGVTAYVPEPKIGQDNEDFGGYYRRSAAMLNDGRVLVWASWNGSEEVTAQEIDGSTVAAPSPQGGDFLVFDGGSDDAAVLGVAVDSIEMRDPFITVTPSLTVTGCGGARLGDVLAAVLTVQPYIYALDIYQDDTCLCRLIVGSMWQSSTARPFAASELA